MNEPQTALEHAERALAILRARSARPSADSLSERFAGLVSIAERSPEIWKKRGREILERRMRACPRESTPYQRLAALHLDAGRRELAVRYASQGVEIEPSEEEYKALAKNLEGMCDSARARACRSLAERVAQ